MDSSITALHNEVVVAVSDALETPATAMVVGGRWHAAVAVVRGVVFAAVLELADEAGIDTDVDGRTGMTLVRVRYTESALPDTAGTVETTRNRALLFKEALQ